MKVAIVNRGVWGKSENAKSLPVVPNEQCIGIAVTAIEQAADR